MICTLHSALPSNLLPVPQRDAATGAEGRIECPAEVATAGRAAPVEEIVRHGADHHDGDTNGHSQVVPGRPTAHDHDYHDGSPHRQHRKPVPTASGGELGLEFGFLMLSMRSLGI